MSELKVGDVCIVLPYRGPSITPEIDGHTVTITGPEELRRYGKYGCFGFEVTSSGGKLYCVHRAILRKIDPPAADDSTPRTEFLPAEPSFVEDLQRQLTRTTEEA